MVLAVSIVSYMCTMFFSAAFHTMLHHSDKVAKLVHKCDLCGSSIAIYNGVFTGVYLGFSGVHETFRLIYLAVSFIMLLVGLAMPFWKAFEPYRIKFLVCSGVVAFIIFLHWSCMANAEQLQLFGGEVVKSFAYLLTGFAFYSTKIPEVWNTGKYDLVFSSH